MWRFGISGDRPIIVVEAAAVRGIGLVRSLVRALRLWSWGGVACDLIILDSEPSSYQMPLQRELSAIREQFVRDIPSEPCELHLHGHGDRHRRPSARRCRCCRGCGFSLTAGRFPNTCRTMSNGTATHCRDGSIRRTRAPGGAEPWQLRSRAARGQFDGTGRFRFSVNATSRPARPWINVLSNPNFGAQISEAGSGYTWAGNSRLHQLTPWSNDPVADPSRRIVSGCRT